MYREDLRAPGLLLGENMPEIKEIVRAIRELTKELRAIRKVLESWDEDPPVGEKEIDECIL